MWLFLLIRYLPSLFFISLLSVIFCSLFFLIRIPVSRSAVWLFYVNDWNRWNMKDTKAELSFWVKNLNVSLKEKQWGVAAERFIYLLKTWPPCWTPALGSCPVPPLLDLLQSAESWGNELSDWTVSGVPAWVWEKVWSRVACAFRPTNTFKACSRYLNRALTLFNFA